MKIILLCLFFLSGTCVLAASRLPPNEIHCLIFAKTLQKKKFAKVGEFQKALEYPQKDPIQTVSIPELKGTAHIYSSFVLDAKKQEFHPEKIELRIGFVGPEDASPIWVANAKFKNHKKNYNTLNALLSYGRIKAVCDLR